MNEREEAIARHRAMIGDAEARANAYRRYFLDEEAYAFAEKCSFTGGKLSFPTESVFDGALSGFDRAAKAFFVCRLYTHLSARENALSAADFLLPEERALPGDHIVYVRNYYTERAYEIFAAALDSPTVSYASDFTDACASVGEGLADLCILPFRDEAWAPFHSFSRMPEHYGLSLCALCTVARTDGDTMRLALCARGCRVPRGAKRIAVELLLSSHDGEDFESLRCLSSTLDGTIVFAEALPDRYTHASSWRVTYELSNGSLAPFLLGRRLLAPDAELLGLYEMPSFSEGDA